MTHPELSIVIPVYEEAESLPELASRIRTECERAGITFEVWFIDDGSRDASWAAIRKLSQEDARFHGVRFRRNYGKSAALAVGFRHASGRWVATLDADLQDDPAELPHLVATMREGQFDLISGWKKRRHDPLSKTVPSRFFNAATRFFSGIPLHDFNCGLKIYRNEVVKSVRLYGELHRYVPLLAKWEGYTRIGERVVQHHPRKHGRTKFGLERFLRGFLDLITVSFLTRFAARPMHFFGGMGSVAFFIGFLIAGYLSIDKLVGGNPLGNRPLLLLAVTLLVIGVQLFTTGLMGEMFVRPRMEHPDAYDIRETI